ncbi:hypothetical protein [Rhizohabitans arisaemae]|uniref:hypothetical protein n=1 Tax=Rhizohabitans arisaemae TaxID=2720610 RepID=UPI0024B1463D|nr:hypothetical protein [Rhizohabitans arisaemae]
MRVPRTLFLLLAASGWLTLTVVQSAPGPVRLVASLTFLLLGPGFAVVAAIRPMLSRKGYVANPLEATALALALSVSLGVLVSETFFLLGRFEAADVLMVLAGLTTWAALWALVRDALGRRRSRRLAGRT